MENKITREEYLNALELIDNYHRQLNKKPILKSIFKCEVGDFVVYNNVSELKSKFFTKGKHYEIKEVYVLNDLVHYFYVNDDNCKTKRIRPRTRVFSLI